MDINDQIILQSDLGKLWEALGDLSDYAQKVDNAEEREKLLRIIFKFEKFSDIHRVRTYDLITYREKIEKARVEYRSLKLRYDGLKELTESQKNVINRIMNEKMDNVNTSDDDKELGF